MNGKSDHIEIYGTSPSRAALGLTAGALIGAFAVAVPPLFIAWYVDGLQFYPSRDLYLLSITFVAAFIVWTIGLIVFGLPLWWLCHRNGWRSRRAAGFVGAAATFVVNFGIEAGLNALRSLRTNSSYSAGDSDGMTIMDNQLTPHGWWNVIQGSVLLSAVGVIVALVIWQIAYRRINDGEPKRFPL